jgi:nucleoside-diphosphate-sugar epimerase
MNLVVTGGAGFIGSHLVEFLLKQNQTVTALDNLENGNMDNLKSVKKDIEFHNVDILNYSNLEKILSKCDCVFHHAALTSVSDSFDRSTKYHEVNVSGTENILKLAKEYGFKVIFASSASVYGNPEKIPIEEDASRKPLNPYGLSKLDAENLCTKYSEQGVSVIGLRYFNVYGPRQNKNYAGVITKFIDNALDTKPLLINGDGSQVRDFVFVNDVANANFLAMKNKTNHAFINIGSGVATPIKELADMIMKLYGLESGPIYGNLMEGDIRYSQANIDLAKKLLDWKPNTKLKEWLNENMITG